MVLEGAIQTPQGAVVCRSKTSPATGEIVSVASHYSSMCPSLELKEIGTRQLMSDTPTYAYTMGTPLQLGSVVTLVKHTKCQPPTAPTAAPAVGALLCCPYPSLWVTWFMGKRAEGRHPGMSQCSSVSQPNPVLMVAEGPHTLNCVGWSSSKA